MADTVGQGHVVTTDDSSDLAPEQTSRGLRGATGGVFVGPSRPNSSSHAVPSANLYPGGGAEDTTGYRESDTYDATGGTGGGTGFGATGNSNTRPSRFTNASGTIVTGPTAYTGDGVQGGSTPGAVVDATGRAIDTGSDRFGRSLTSTTAGYPLAGSGGRYTYTNFDGRTTSAPHASRALGMSGRGSTATGTGQPDTVTGETVSYTAGERPVPGATRVGVNTARGAVLAVPTYSGVVNPSAGVVSVAAGTALATVDVNAADVTGGGNKLKGARIWFFKRRTDTDEDEQGALVAIKDLDSATQADVTLTAGTYAVYAAWRYLANDGIHVAVGPRGARTTVLVS
jgi:hypothetical protein